MKDKQKELLNHYKESIHENLAILLRRFGSLFTKLKKYDMQQYNIDFTTQFKEDILSIYNFIKQDNVEYADAVINSILSHCTGLLSIMPYI
jgi:hypothetical protein